MKRTQIQLPDKLYEEIRQTAKTLDWSVSEVLRRGAEYMVSSYRHAKPHDWRLPEPRPLGAMKVSAESLREMAYDTGE